MLWRAGEGTAAGCLVPGSERCELLLLEKMEGARHTRQANARTYACLQHEYNYSTVQGHYSYFVLYRGHIRARSKGRKDQYFRERRSALPVPPLRYAIRPWYTTSSVLYH